MRRNLSYEAGKEHARILLESLLRSVEEGEGESKDLKANWQEDTQLWVTYSTLKGLAELTKKYSNQSLNTENIRNALLCLQVLNIVEDKREEINSKTKTNSKVWRFVLKFNSIETQQNLEWLFKENGEWDKRRQAQKIKSSKVSTSEIPKYQGTILEKDEFRTYLSSILRNKEYQNYSHLYTQTDVVEKQQIHMPLEVRSINEGKTPYPVLEGIRKYAKNHVLLVGKPGSGKSTALRRLLWEEAGNLERMENGEEGLSLGVIPVLVELRSWQEGSSVVELIKGAFLKNELQLDEEKIRKLLIERKLLLLLDGLNELPSDDSRRLVTIFRNSFPNTPMIFTTRDLAVGGDLGIENKLEMLPLTLQQMRQFVQAYLPEQGEQMLRQLDDRLRELGETPLILRMFCEVFGTEKQIPKNRGKLFRTFDKRLDELKNRDSLSVTENLLQWKPELLGHLAFTMMEGEKSPDIRLIISQTKAEKILEALLKNRVTSPAEKAKKWLQDLLKNYFIQQVDKKQLQFPHQLFQEYYAAEYLLELLPKLSDEKFKKDYLNLLKWTESIALALNLLDDEAQTLRIVHLALDVDFMLGAFLAGEVQYKFQQKTIDIILKKKPSKRLEMDLLSNTHSQFAEKYLNGYLKDKNSSVREYAVYALTKIGSDTSVNSLILALKDEDFEVRRQAIKGLRDIGSEAAVNPLIHALKDEHSFVRSSAVEALVMIKGKASINFLINALKDEDEEKDLFEYGSGLFMLKINVREDISEANFNLLIQALKDERSSVRRLAVQLLSSCRDEVVINSLIQALKDENSSVRYYAAEAFRFIGNEATVNPLIQALKDENSSVRLKVVEALGDIKSEVAVNPLIQALKDENSSVRLYAVYGLRDIGSEAAVNPLIQALNDEYSLVSSYAAKALVDIGGEVGVNAVIQALKDKSSSVRCAAVEALVKITSETAVNSLIQALKDESSSVRASAAEALGKIKSEAAVNSLIECLKDNKYVGYYAAEALGKIGSKAAVNPLIYALKNQSSQVRRSAAQALGEIGDEAAVNPLIRALKDKDLFVREYAVRALENIGSEAAVKPLIHTLKDEYSQVSSAAARALQKIATSSNLSEKLKMLSYEVYFANGVIFKIQETCKFYNYDIFNSDSLPATRLPSFLLFFLRVFSRLRRFLNRSSSGRKRVTTRGILGARIERE
ncbi:peptidase C14 caspase catalytic subunit p20 [Scytonema sp. HK-05]|nr:peptidase C14 caspase catalytic subunit p20 [Scytonema sp. HK-05]